MANRNDRQKNIRKLGNLAENIAKIALELEAMANAYNEAKPTITFWLLSCVDPLNDIAQIIDDTRKEI